MKSTKIFIGNLPESAEGELLQELFEKYGEVKECDIIKNYGFVHMNTEEDARAAIDGLNNTEFMGTKITVELSHSKVRPRPGMGGKGQCYRCGRQGHWSKECPRNPSARMAPGGPPMFPSPYGDRLSRFGLDRPYNIDRFGGDRMRPYPDPYDRRPPLPPPPGAPNDDFMYYRRPYEDFGYTRRSPPPPPPPAMQAASRFPPRFDFGEDAYMSGGYNNYTSMNDSGVSGFQ